MANCGMQLLFLPLIPVSGTKLLICLTQRHLWRDGLRIAGFAPRNVLAPSQGHPRKGTVGLLYHVKSLRSKLLSDMSASRERSNSTWLAQMISNKGDNHVKKPLQLHQTHMILIYHIFTQSGLFLALSLNTRFSLLSFLSFIVPSSLYYKPHLSRQYSCRSLRCSWSIACRRCTNYIFIYDLTTGFTELGKDN